MAERRRQHYGSTTDHKSCQDDCNEDCNGEDNEEDDYDNSDDEGLTPLNKDKGLRPQQLLQTMTKLQRTLKIIRCCLSMCSSRKACSFLWHLLLLSLLLLSYRRTLRLESHLSSLTNQFDHASAATAHQLLHINATLAQDEAIMQRFQSQVSNQEVIARVDALEHDWKDKEDWIGDELNATKQEIEAVLEDTVHTIHNTVTSAQNQINSQVQSVQTTLSTYIRTTQDQFSTENSFMVYQLAGTFTLLGCLISMWHMTSHLRHFHQPVIQRKILAILWMCPIYSITSWLSLVMPAMEGYLAILKDLYEAYVIYQFLSFLIAVLGKGDRSAVVELLAQHADHLSPPIRICGWFRQPYFDTDYPSPSAQRRLAGDVLLQCQVFAMQFVFLRPLLTAALFLLHKLHISGNSNSMVDYTSPQFYLVILENISVFLAFSGLLKFYHAVQDNLSWCRPFPKFLCIKGVVFMTFWQGIVISLLADTTDILGGSNGTTNASTDDANYKYEYDDDQQEIYAKQAQNFLICLEMLGFSIAHFYCFPVEEWEEGYRPIEDRTKFGDNMALGDFVHDLKLILRQNVHKRREGRKSNSSNLKSNASDNSISTVLEEDEESGSPSEERLESLLENVTEFLEASKGKSVTEEDALAAENDNNLSHEQIATPIKRKKTVEQSLQEMNAPLELRRATALLLQSSLLDENTAKLLTSDILDQSYHNDDEGSMRLEGNDLDDEADAENSSDASLNTPRKNSMGASDSAGLPPPPSASPPPPPDESSLLIASRNEDLLRPSIFTLVDQASLEEENKE